MLLLHQKKRGVIKIEETQRINEPKFRTNFKQSAKGIWYAEFTVRGDSTEELNTDIGKVRAVINTTLELLNEEAPKGASDNNGDTKFKR